MCYIIMYNMYDNVQALRGLVAEELVVCPELVLEDLWANFDQET